MLYREFADQESLDVEYNPAARSDEGDRLIPEWTADSEAARRELDCVLGLKFGPTIAEYLDIFPAGPEAPVHIFIHGGYWRRFTAADYSFIARRLVDAGVTTVINNYALCPVVTIDEIVRQIRAAIIWTHNNISSYGGDPDRLTISGHSAGGHLVGMAVSTAWQRDYGVAASIIKGGCAISGLYDLNPFPYTYLQPKIQLTWEQVRNNSPITQIPNNAPPLTVAVGGSESAEFRRQSRDYLAAWQAAGHEGSWLEPVGKDHFTVLEAFREPGSPLLERVIKMAMAQPQT